MVRKDVLTKKHRLILILLSLLIVFPGAAAGREEQAAKTGEASGWSKSKLIIGGGACQWPDASNDGNTLVFVDASGGDDYQKKIKVVEYSRNAWGEPRTIAANAVTADISAKYTRPVISGNGKTIAFMGYTGAQYPDAAYKIYISDKKSDGSWDSPRVIDAIQFYDINGLLAISDDGGTLAFTASNSFWGEAAKLYACTRLSGAWETPVRISGEQEDLLGYADQPSLSADGKKIAWVQSNYAPELLYSEKAGDAWSPPQRLTNTAESEEYPKISGDGDTIVFWRVTIEGNVLTAKDLYALRRDGSGWHTPEKLTATPVIPAIRLDGCAAVNADGTRVVYSRTSREGDTINAAHLEITGFSNGKWSAAKALTDTKYMYDVFPKLTPDGRTLTYQGPDPQIAVYNAFWQKTDTGQPPEEPGETPGDLKVIGSKPENGSAAVKITTKSISINFNQPIAKGSNFKKISFIAEAGGANKTIKTTAAVKGDVLTIKWSAKLEKGSAYTLTIPAKAVKDKKTGKAALAGDVMISFSTGQ